MHSIYSSDGVRLLGVKGLGLEAIALLLSLLVLVTNAEIAKTKASFLDFGAVDIWRHNVLLVSIVVDHLAQVFLKLIYITISIFTISIEVIDPNS